MTGYFLYWVFFVVIGFLFLASLPCLHLDVYAYTDHGTVWQSKLAKGNTFSRANYFKFINIYPHSEHCLGDMQCCYNVFVRKNPLQKLETART